MRVGDVCNRERDIIMIESMMYMLLEAAEKTKLLQKKHQHACKDNRIRTEHSLKVTFWFASIYGQSARLAISFD